MLQPHVTIPHAREWTTKELQSTNHINIPRVREWLTNVLQTTPHVSIPSVREGVNDQCATIRAWTTDML